MNDIKFIKQQGGLARTAPGEDHISGFQFYGPTGSIPTKEQPDPADANATINTQTITAPTAIFSLKQAENLGIVPNTQKAADSPTYIHSIWHYHISEFFRVNPSGILWLNITEKDSGFNFKEILDLQRDAEGSLRQIAVYLVKNMADGHIPKLQEHADTLAAEHKPLSILYAADVNTKNLSNFKVKTEGAPNSNVSVIVGQAAAATGGKLFTDHEVSISCIGATLGAVSRSQVHENIGWVQEFNIAGAELDQIMFATGESYNSIPPNELDTLSNEGFIFLRKHIGISGTYFNDSHTASDPQSDFAYIENNRTIDKAIRGIRRALLPQLNAPLYVEDNGNIAFDSIKYFETLASRPVERMRIDGEVSNFQVTIPANQDILSTSKLDINVQIIPVGVARTIEVTIGFTVSIA